MFSPSSRPNVTHSTARPGRLRRILRRCLKLALAAVVLLAVWTGFLYLTLPDVGFLKDRNPDMTSYIKLWAAEAGVEPDAYAIREWTPYADMAPLLIRCVVYAEDTGFYGHNGVEWELTRKNAWRYLNGRSASGASTITQQLVRNLFLDGDFSVNRKVREILLALKLERTVSKERILELYLNMIEFGEGVWGITRAADHYFGKSPAALDPFECVFLPAILPSPRRELHDQNLYRATGVFRRLCFYLHRSDEMTIDEWVFAKRGLGALEIALKQGSGLEEALQTAAAANPPAADG